MPRSNKSSSSRQRSSRSSSRAASPARFPLFPSKPGLFPDQALASAENWAEFLNQVQILGLEKQVEEVLKMTEYFRHLAARVNELGGWLEVTGKDIWGQVSLDPSRVSRVDYEVYLFPILKAIEFQNKYHSGNPYNITLGQLDPSTIVPIKVFTPPASGQLTPAFWEEVFSQDIAILRGFVEEVWGFSHSCFTVDYLEEHSGDKTFDVLIQDRSPDLETIKLRSGEKRKCSVREYIEKMRKEKEEGAGTGPVPFAVNVDIGGWKSQIDELRAKIPDCLNFGTRDDGLRHLRLHVNGMTLPQLYLKVQGCWTGAHQENLGFTAVNINHGPGACQWWSLCPEFNGKLRDDIMQRQRFDPLKSETLWWPDENYLMAQRYKTYYGLQESGDLVFVGPATLHWVKSVSATVNSAWNIGTKSIRQFEVAFQREALNRVMDFESLVQMHTLAMDLLNAEMGSLSPDFVTYLSQKIQTKYNEETAMVAKCNMQNLGVFPGHLVRRCELCKLEIFYAYAPCNQCDAALCMTCAQKHSHLISGYCVMFSADHYERLMHRVAARCSGSDVDCFDPGLNLHFDSAEKQRVAGAWTSVHSGAPNCIYFELKPVEMQVDNEEIEKAEKKTRSSDTPSVESGKKRKVAGGRAVDVPASLTQASHAKPYTRSQARRAKQPAEDDEVEEEQLPSNPPRQEESPQLLDTSAPSTVESPVKTDPPKPKESTNHSALKTIEMREISGTEVSIDSQEVRSFPQVESEYMIPKRLKPTE